MKTMFDNRRRWVGPVMALALLIPAMAMVTPAFQNGQWQFNLVAGASATPSPAETAVKAAVPSLLPKDEQPPAYRLLNDPRVVLEGAQRQDVEDGKLYPPLAQLVEDLLDGLAPDGLKSLQVGMIQTGHCVHVDCDDTMSVSDHSDGHAIDVYGLNGVFNVTADNPLVCPVVEWLYTERAKFKKIQVISTCTIVEDGNSFFDDPAQHSDHIHIAGR